jgi:hypothetical protein
MKTRTTRKKQRPRPRLRVVITRVADDETLIYDFQMKRRPTVERVRLAVEAFKSELLKTVASS